MATTTATLDPARADAVWTRAPERRARTVARIDVNLLGGFEVRINGRSLPSGHWSRRHSAALVKLLAMSPGRTLHREVVIEALWPETSIEDAAPRLHKAAHYARKTLGHRDAVVLNADAVSLCPDDDVRVDMVRFRHLAQAALNDGSIAAAKAALAVYGGDLLPQDVYEPWTDQHRVHLHRLNVELLHQAEDWHRALAADPADELAHLALAERYAERGDRAAALRQLDQLDAVMRHELGLEPSERAWALRRQVVHLASRRDAVDEVSPACHEVQPAPARDLPRQCCAVAADDSPT